MGLEPCLDFIWKASLQLQFSSGYLFGRTDVFFSIVVLIPVDAGVTYYIITGSCLSNSGMVQTVPTSSCLNA